METLYLVKPDFAQTQEVVRQFDHAGKWIGEAVELMKLAGDDERAKKLDRVWLRAYEREPSFLNTADIEEMLDLIEGLEAKLVGTVVDEEWILREEQLPELRARTSFELDESRGSEAIYGVAEAMSRVAALRTVLQGARTDNLYIAVE